ncbi:hypothetical protein TcWFU_010447 [Taenia crassiceps]|uniref:Transposase n=1 Tax=Taenia crassiceps TaxID=6207 RepID=A0ABR4Q5A2_9CEST
MKEELVPPQMTIRRYPKCVREEILSWAREGKNWSQRAKELGIRHQSAYYWVSSAHKRPLQRAKPKAKRPREQPISGQMNSKVVEFVCSLYEADPKITLAQICLRLQGEMSVTVAQSTAHKYLRGMVFTRSRLPPPDYTSLEAKEETRKYISALSSYMQQGKEIIWLGGTIFNLHTRKSVSRLQELHIHSMAAISSNLGLLHASFKRGPYTKHDQEVWIHQHLQPELLTDAVLVSDAFEENSNVSAVVPVPRRLRLAPLHTDRLNPCEAYWTKVTERVKARLLSGEAHLPAGSATDENQRLGCLERLLTDAMATVAVSNGSSEVDCEGGEVEEDVCDKAVRDSTESLTDVLQLVTGLKVEQS